METMVFLVRASHTLSKKEAVDWAARIAREFGQFDRFLLEEDEPTVFAVFVANPTELDVEAKKRKLVAELIEPISFGIGETVALAKSDLRDSLRDTVR
jgi:hypothetical protein